MVKTLLKPAPDKADLAMTIIRVITGLVFFVHGWQKVFSFGFAGVGGFLAVWVFPLPDFLPLWFRLSSYWVVWR